MSEPTQFAAPACRSATAFDPYRLRQLDQRIRRHVDAGRIPGAAWLIWHRGRVVHQEAYGVRDPDSGARMQIDSVFRIYSMTKPIVTVAAMMLVEEGRMLISDPVAAYLPELSSLQVGIEEDDGRGGRRLKLVPVEREMTVQDLMRHTAGLTYGKFGGDTLVKRCYRASPVESGTLSNSELVQALARLPLFAQPGTIWEYSRATDVLGALVERISGQALDQFLAQRILAPLAMRDTGFFVPEDQQHRIAQPFATDPVTGKPVKLLDVTQKPAFLSGGGGMVSTLADYLRFARMLAAGGTLDGVRILAPKTIAFMTSDHLAELPRAKSGPSFLPGPGYGFGLGFAVRTHAGAAPTPGSVGEYNWSGVGGTYFWVDPQEELIAIWMMQAPEQRSWYRQMFRNLVYAAM